MTRYLRAIGVALIFALTLALTSSCADGCNAADSLLRLPSEWMEGNAHVRVHAVFEEQVCMQRMGDPGIYQ